MKEKAESILRKLFGGLRAKEPPQLVQSLEGVTAAQTPQTNLQSIDSVVWPSLEEMESNKDKRYRIAQIEYDGRTYYRITPSFLKVSPHEETIKIAERLSFPGVWGEKEKDGHPVAFDSFVREIAQKGYDPSRVTKVRGCDARYINLDIEMVKRDASKVDFYIYGKSFTFGKPEGNMQQDLISSNPPHLKLHFGPPPGFEYLA
ncbi:MAG: hypothetical protein AABX32_03600 [Nanoarchaeota archaeon]